MERPESKRRVSPRAPTTPRVQQVLPWFASGRCYRSSLLRRLPDRRFDSQLKPEEVAYNICRLYDYKNKHV